MKKFTLLYFFLIFFITSFSQDYANSWIKNYNQYYYKIKITQNGVYRISKNIITNAGIDINTINPKTFQIFGKGEEQYIYVKGEDDGVFNDDDYIEFYAERNDGWLDTVQYGTKEKTPNPYYSLYNDTLVYYLTWNDNLVGNRRVSVNSSTNFSSYSPAQYVITNNYVDYHSSYYTGEPFKKSIGSKLTNYQSSQGWFSSRLSSGSPTLNASLSTPEFYSLGEDAIAEFAFIGMSNDYESGNDQRMQISHNSALIFDTVFEGYKLIKKKIKIPVANLSAGNTFAFTRATTNTTITTMVVSYVNVTYPRTLNFVGTLENRFKVKKNQSQNKIYIKALNFSNNEDKAFIYDFKNKARIQMTEESVSGNKNQKVLLDTLGEEIDCYIFLESAVKNISKLNPVAANARFEDYTNKNINTDFIILTDRKFYNESVAYLNYRISTGHSPIIVFIDELYDQFSYGIVKNPLAITNFSKYIYDNWNHIPENLFIIGKSYVDSEYRKNANYYANTCVPTYGNPGSDIKLTSGIVDQYCTPVFSTGRLPVLEASEINDYLEKVKDFESQHKISSGVNWEEDLFWMKNVLHFGGGNSASEIATLKSYLNSLKTVIEDTLKGSIVRSFFKESSAPISDITYADSIKNLINNGVEIMNFFAHGSTTTGFDQDVDSPDNYDNYKKYPLIIAQSCLVSNIFSTEISTSEKFVFEPRKGAIGFLGTASLGIPSYLYNYTRELYSQISYKGYGNSIGKQMKSTITKIQNSQELVQDICYEMTLNGDPSIKLYSPEKPDFAVNESSIFLDLKEITAEIDSFYVNVVVSNVGKSISDTNKMFIELTRTFPDGSTEKYYTETETTVYRDTCRIYVGTNSIKSPGLNKISVLIDSKYDYDELSEANNIASYNFNIKSNDLLPVYPIKYAVVPSKNITLKASTFDQFIGQKDFIIQVDTTDLFNSPIVRQYTSQSMGGVVKWDINLDDFTLSELDSTVFFWRVKVNSSGYSWRSSSFKYIPNKSGWSQGHFFQFENNTYQLVNYNRNTRNFKFINQLKEISVQTDTYREPDNQVKYYDVWCKMNGAMVRSHYGLSWLSGLGIPGFVFIWIDQVTGEPYTTYDDNKDGYGDTYGNRLLYMNPEKSFDFYAHNSTWANKIVDFVKDIPDGDIICMYNVGLYNYFSNYTQDYIDAFKSFGCDSAIIVGNGNNPLIVFGRKGMNPGEAKHTVGSLGTLLQMQDTFSTNWKNGTIISEEIGPALKWNSLHWNYKQLDDLTSDTLYLSVIGIKPDGTEEIVLNNILKNTKDIYNLDATIDATLYPKIKLKLFTMDENSRTPVHLNYWEVLYDEIPETALNLSAGYFFHKDTLLEGDNVILSLATENISNSNFKKDLVIKYWIQDKNRNNKSITYKNVGEHNSGDILKDTISFSTKGLLENNILWMEVNPYIDTLNRYDQEELYHFNNIVGVPFYVEKDNTNPLLDVTFDGVYIMDGDIVSAKPTIKIALEDENKFLLLSDTSLIRVYLRRPGIRVDERIYFNDKGQGIENMIFQTAIDNKNKCTIDYNPTFIQDGKYKLIVQAKDASNNVSGELDYEINFEVVTKSTITNVFNYPNPFSTSTKFVFTLTGAEVPTYMKIQIYTITGKVIKEISLEELGDIHIGRNITEYSWDGTDEFGDRLANGVYLYRVISKINNEKIELRQTSADQYFNNGFGKMYIIK